MIKKPVSNQRWKAIGLVLGAWTFFGLFFASQRLLMLAHMGRKLYAVPNILLWIVYAYIWALLTPLVVRLARRHVLLGRRWPRAVLVHIVAGIGVTVLALTLFFPLQWLAVDAPLSFETVVNIIKRLAVEDLHSGVLIYWAIVGLTQAFDTYRAKQQREIVAAQLQARTSQLEANLANAQLDALKMQLHPHFLFNTLNTISVMMQQDVPAANKMLLRLSSLLRIALTNSGEHEIPVRDELEFLRNYLEIEQTRFGNRLSVKIEADPGSLDALVPNMVLQPLAENAIRHGVGLKSLKGTIEVKVARLNGSVVLSVYDSGPGPGAGKDPGNGIGLTNTKARLAQLYGSDSTLELSQSPGGGMIASVTVPYHV